MMNKVYFPRMVAPLVYIGSETVDLCASFIVLFIMMAFYKVTPGLSIFALPFFVCLVILAGTAFGLLLAALSVNVRDVSIALRCQHCFTNRPHGMDVFEPCSVSYFIDPR
jgi:ABC-type polysaccharide/polyol phosphate export permease